MSRVFDCKRIEMGDRIRTYEREELGARPNLQNS